MKRYRALAIVLLVFILGGALVQASVSSEFLSNGFIALYYHALRLEESFPTINPMGLAIAEFEKATREASSADEALVMMGLIYQYLERPGTALGYFLEFAKNQPEEIWIYSLIGDMYAEMGRHNEAEEYYNLAVTEVVYAQAFVGIGNMALEQGDHVKAKEAFEKAVDQAGDFLDARLGLGKALYYLEEYDEAIAALELAQFYGSHSISTHYYLGLSYEAAGLVEEAEHAFSRVDELQQRQ